MQHQIGRIPIPRQAKKKLNNLQRRADPREAIFISIRKSVTFSVETP